MANTPHIAEDSISDQTQIDAALARFQTEIAAELRRVVDQASADPAVAAFYGQMAYHLGWVDKQLQPVTHHPGKLIRPALVLWSCELAGVVAGASAASHKRRHEQALAAAAAVELVHNFSLIHDDIEDHDELRRHRPTLWTIWGAPQGINTGDGMFCLARLALWETVARGYPAAQAVRLARILDQTCLRLCEGQYLDMAHEGQAGVGPERYLAMIARKTAALMRCATELGARIGAPEGAATSEALGDFGEELGVAFQLRDDLLGIWAETRDLGKASAGDLRRKKMSLPVIHALATAAAAERATLLAIYQAPGPATDAQIATMLDILESTSRAWCRAQLVERCAQARHALERAYASAPALATSAPVAALGALVRFIARAGSA